MPDDSPTPQIPAAALERWQSLADEAPLELAFTKADLDNLLLSLRNMAIGQSELVAALFAHTNQDLDGCVEGMMRANELSHAAFARINGLVGAVMAKAVLSDGASCPGGAVNRAGRGEGGDVAMQNIQQGTE